MYSQDDDDALPTTADYSYLRGLSADAAPVLIGRKDLTGDAVPWMHAYEEDQRSETRNLGIRNFNLSLWQAKGDSRRNERRTCRIIVFSVEDFR